MRHAYDCWVRWSDVDSYGHVNNVKYLEYYQEARIAFYSALAARNTTDAAVVVRIVVDYRLPILFRLEPYTIETWASRIGRSSYDLESRILDGNRVLSTARVSMVAYDSGTERSRPLNDTERAGLSKALEA